MTVILSVFLITIVITACIMYWVADRGCLIFTRIWVLGWVCSISQIVIHAISKLNGFESIFIILALLIAGTIGAIGGFYNYTSRENEAWKRYKMSRSQGGLHD